LKDNRKLKDLPLLATGFLLLFLLDRVIYVILALNGVLDGAPAGDVILGELPTLFFITICAIIVLRWAEIHHFAMSRTDESPIRKAILPVNVILYVFFIVIVLLYFLLPSQKSVTCASTDAERNEISPASVVAYVYKALLAALSLVLAIAVLYFTLHLFVESVQVRNGFVPGITVSLLRRT